MGIEYLKLPVERKNGYWRRLSQLIGNGRDLHTWYREQGAYRNGREFVLPARAKLGMTARVAACTRAAGLTFGAADVEFLHFSDSACCCSGVDKLQGFQGFYRHQIAYALHINRGSTVSLDQIGMEWIPARSSDRFMNSRSRLSTRTSKIGSMQDHIERRWNGQNGG